MKLKWKQNQRENHITAVSFGSVGSVFKNYSCLDTPLLMTTETTAAAPRFLEEEANRKREEPGGHDWSTQPMGRSLSCRLASENTGR
jgi:hypothetical protein